MIEPLTPNTQAIVLLTAPLVTGGSESSRDLLTLGEYNRLAQMLRQKQRQPSDLLAPDAHALIEVCAASFTQGRLESLLGRGFQLSQAVERWNARGIWVLSRADARYPRRLKVKMREDAPPLLYGVGDVALLERGGLAVVGSRQVDEGLVAFTDNVARLSAEAQRNIVSGGARGIDKAAMHGALMAGGTAAGVMADSLERAALARDNREPLMQGRLVLISPYDPAAGFNVGHAMQRNKLIYALADAALVVASDFEKGGTWTGAIEQLNRLRFVPVFVRNGSNAGKGNEALLKRGGKPWPNPQSGTELGLALDAAAELVAEGPNEDTLPLTLWEPQAVYSSTSSASAVNSEVQKSNLPPTGTMASPKVELLTTVESILRRELAEPRTVDEVATLLDVTKPQAKAWLARLVKESVIVTIDGSKPPQFRAVTKSERVI